MTSVLSFNPVKLLGARREGAARAAAGIRLEETPAATILHINARLTMEQVGAFHSSVEVGLGSQAQRIVVNLTASPFIDSAGIAALVTAHERVRKAGKEMVLVGLAPQVVSALEMARLLKAFRVCATVEDAVSGAAGSAGAQ